MYVCYVPIKDLSIYLCIGLLWLIDYVFWRLSLQAHLFTLVRSWTDLISMTFQATKLYSNFSRGGALPKTYCDSARKTAHLTWSNTLACYQRTETVYIVDIRVSSRIALPDSLHQIISLFFLFLLRRPLKKAWGSAISNRIGMKLGTVVLQVNMHRLTPTNFRYDITVTVEKRALMIFLQFCV